MLKFYFKLHMPIPPAPHTERNKDSSLLLSISTVRRNIGIQSLVYCIESIFLAENLRNLKMSHEQLSQQILTNSSAYSLLLSSLSPIYICNVITCITMWQKHKGEVLIGAWYRYFRECICVSVLYDSTYLWYMSMPVCGHNNDCI